MSQSDAKAFVKKLIGDEELRNRLNNEIPDNHDDETTADDVRDLLARVVPDFAKERGYDFTAEEGFEALETIRNEIRSDELSNVELDQVAGGKSRLKKSQIAAGVTSAVSLGFGCVIKSIYDAADGREGCMEP